jgi:hypothetical protein
VPTAAGAVVAEKRELVELDGFAVADQEEVVAVVETARVPMATEPKLHSRLQKRQGEDSHLGRQPMSYLALSVHFG